MAKTLSEEEIKKINEELEKKKKTPTLSGTDRLTGENNYRKQLENLGKETKYDYLEDFDKIKNSLLSTAYSPYTRKAYSYDEKQNLTEEQYFNDLMETANYTENFSSWEDIARNVQSSAAKSLLNPVSAVADLTKAVSSIPNTREGKAFIYGANETLGGTALYKAIKGEEALKEKANQVSTVYNRPGAQLLGNVAGTISAIELGSTIGAGLAGTASATTGALAGRAVAGGLSAGSRAYTYSNDPAEIAAATAVGATYGLVSGITTNAIKSAILNTSPTLITKIGTDLAVNAASSGIGAYAGTAASGTLGNTISAIGGKEVKFDDWIKPFWSAETLTNVAVASVIGGATGTVKDQSALKTLPNTVKNDVRTMYAEGYARAKAIDNSLKNGYIDDAKTLAASELDSIERYANKKYVGGLHMGEAFKQQTINEWVKLTENIFERNGYQFSVSPTGTTTQSYTPTAGLIPTYGGIPNSPSTTMPNTSILTTQPSDGNLTTNIVNADNIKYNNAGGVIENGQGNVELTSKTRAIQELYGIMGEHNTSRAAEDALSREVTNLNEYQNTLKKISESEGVSLHFFDNNVPRLQDMYAFSTRNDGIFIDASVDNQADLDFYYGHEKVELALLNNIEKVADTIGEYVSMIHDNEEALAKYFMWRLSGLSERLWNHYNSETGLYELAKEVVCDISATFNMPSTDYATFLKQTFGEEVVKTIAEGVNQQLKNVDLSKGSAEPTSGNNYSTPPALKTNNDKIKNLTIEKQNKDIGKLEEANANLQNKLSQRSDQIQATEMWSKRTERKKLNKKLDTAKNKLEQTKFDSKEKIKATKEEGKEKLHKLTSKKNQEKAEAVKTVKEQASKTLRKVKDESKEKIKDAKQQARATTTDKKMRLSLNRLDKALNKVYDQPQSEELDKALDAVRKQGRGTIKLVNNIRNKIPSSYSHFADDVLDIVDTYYTGGNAMTDEKRASLEKKAKAIEEYAKEHPEYPLSKKAIDLLKEPNKKNISDLNPRDLVSLAEDLQEIGIAVRDMFSFARASEDAIKLRTDAIDFINERLKNVKEPRNIGYELERFLKEQGDKRSTIKYLTSVLSDGNPHSPLKFIPDQLIEGYDRYNRAYEKMLKLFDKYVTVKKLGNVRYYNNKLNEIFDPKKKLDVTLKTISGKEYTPSIRDAISVVLGAKDRQFAGHTIGVVTDKFDQGEPVLSDGGIAVFANNVDEQHGQMRTGFKRGVKVKLEASDIKNIEKALEKYPVTKELMETFKEFTDLTYDLNNEVYEAINGMSLEKRDYYIPVTTDPATRARQSVVDTIKSKGTPDASNSLLNVSIVKPVVEGANGQILIYPIDDIINKLVNDTALYNGYGTALYDINTFLSAMTPDGETLEGLIGHVMPSYMKNLNTITDAIVGRTNHPNGGALAGNFTKGILKGNFWLALKQAGSYFTTSPYFDHTTRSMIAGIFNRGNMAKTIKEYYKEQGIDISKLNATDTLKYFWRDKVNAELDIRDRGYGKADKDILLKHSGLIKRLRALDWYKTVDIATINALAFASFEDSLLNPDGKLLSDEQLRELSTNFIDLHTSTQPNVSPATRAPIQVNGNIVDRALAFMGDPRIKNRNALLTAKKEYDWSRKHGTAEEKKEYKKRYANMIAGTLASLAYITWVSRTKQDVGGKEKKTTFLEDMIGNMFGLTIGLEQIVGKFLNDYSFDVSLPDTQAISLLFKAGEDLAKVFESAGDTQKMMKYIGKTIEDFSSITGIPYKNLKNTFEDLLRITGIKKTESKGKKSGNSKLDAI